MAVMQPGPAIVIHDVLDNRRRTIPVPEQLSGINWGRDGKRIAAMTTNSAPRSSSWTSSGARLAP
jgi:hypothetical protein